MRSAGEYYDGLLPADAGGKRARAVLRECGAEALAAHDHLVATLGADLVAGSIRVVR
jgi:hypothetical protein